MPVAEGLGMDAVGLAHFSASVDGTLAYRAGDTRSRQLLWVDREGNELEAIGDAGEYGDLWPAPDGHRIVFDMPEAASGNLDLWVRDIARGATSRFTFDPGNDSTPVWSPDGRTIVFTSDREGVQGTSTASWPPGPERRSFSSQRWTRNSRRTGPRTGAFSSSRAGDRDVVGHLGAPHGRGR